MPCPFSPLSCCSEVALRSPSPHSSRTPTRPPCCKPMLKLELCSPLQSHIGLSDVSSQPEGGTATSSQRPCCHIALKFWTWTCEFDEGAAQHFWQTYCCNPNDHMWLCTSQTVSELFVYLPSFEGGRSDQEIKSHWKLKGMYLLYLGRIRSTWYGFISDLKKIYVWRFYGWFSLVDD